MASELYVETLKGLTSGANANKVIIPSGQTLDASAGSFIPAVGQVVQTVYNSTTSALPTASSNGFTDIGLNVNITPQYSDSLIFVALNANTNQNNSNGHEVRITRLDGATNTQVIRGLEYISSTSFNRHGQIYLAGFDSPGTTNTLTYKSQQSNYIGNGSTRVGVSGYLSTIYAVEIKQ